MPSNPSLIGDGALASLSLLALYLHDKNGANIKKKDQMPIHEKITHQSDQNRRKGLRTPVYLDARCELYSGTTLECKVISLGTGGIGIRTEDLLPAHEKVIVEFLIPGTLTAIETSGEVVWCQAHPKEHRQDNPSYLAGIKFKGLARDRQIQLLDYILAKVLGNDDLLQSNDIRQIMSHIRHMPPTDRLRYYRILTKRKTAS